MTQPTLPKMLPLYRAPEVPEDGFCNITNHWTGEGSGINLYLLGKDEEHGDVWGCAKCLQAMQIADPKGFAAIRARDSVKPVTDLVDPV